MAAKAGAMRFLRSQAQDKRMKLRYLPEAEKIEPGAMLMPRSSSCWLIAKV